MNLSEVVVRVVSSLEQAGLSELLREHHYLGFNKCAGEQIFHVAEYGATDLRSCFGRPPPASGRLPRDPGRLERCQARGAFKVCGEEYPFFDSTKCEGEKPRVIRRPGRIKC